MVQTGDTQKMIEHLSREEIDKEIKMQGLVLIRLLYAAENFIQVVEGYGVGSQLETTFPDYVALKEQVEETNKMLDRGMPE